VGVVNDILYAVGGQDQLGAVEAYDPATDTWTAKATVPTPRSGNGSGVVNGILYTVDGPSRQLQAYDPVTDAWTTKAPMPTARTNFAVSVVNGILYALGGHFSETGFDISVEAYDPAADSWTAGTTRPGRVFTVEGAGVVNGLIHIVNDGDGHGVYDPATDTWTAAALLPSWRDGTGVGVVNGVLHVLGGVDQQYDLIVVGITEAYVP